MIEPYYDDHEAAREAHLLDTQERDECNECGYAQQGELCTCTYCGVPRLCVECLSTHHYEEQLNEYQSEKESQP